MSVIGKKSIIKTFSLCRPKFKPKASASCVKRLARVLHRSSRNQRNAESQEAEPRPKFSFGLAHSPDLRKRVEQEMVDKIGSFRSKV